MYIINEIGPKFRLSAQTDVRHHHNNYFFKFSDFKMDIFANV